jgi:hypothetical protein
VLPPTYIYPNIITDSYYFAYFAKQKYFAFIPLVIIMFRKKDGGISVVAKKRSAIGTFF